MKKFLLLVTALSVLACADSSGPDVGPDLRLSVDSLVVAMGSGATVLATIVNSSESAQFVTRDANVATVNATGSISAVGLGTTYIVASLPSTPAARDSVRVRVVEPGQPGTMNLLGSGVVTERYTSEVAAVGNHAYTGTWGFREVGNLGIPGDVIKVWNVSGNTPQLVDSVKIPDAFNVSDLQVSSDGTLLVASLEFGNTGLLIYSLADPARPALVGRWVTPIRPHTVKLGRVNNRHYAFVAAQSDFTLAIVDITDPAHPQQVHISQPGGFIHDTFVRDGYLFVALWNTGLRIYDIGGGGRGGTPANPAVISTIVTSLCSTCSGGASVHNVWWFHNPNNGERRYAFVGEEGPGSVGSLTSRGALHVVDVSDLTQPQEVAIYEPAPATTANGAIAGAHNFTMDEASEVLYAAFYNGGVRALDVRGDLSVCTDAQKTNNLCDLRKMGRELGATANTNPPKYVWGVARVGTNLYASDMHVGIHKIDISGLQR